MCTKNESKYFEKLPMRFGSIVLCSSIALSSILSGCGGAVGEETKTGTSGTGMAAPSDPTVSSGPATSLDPLTLAGNRLDETGAVVVINSASNRSSNDLRLGMSIDVSGEFGVGGTTPKATLVSAQSLVRGPLRGVDSARQQLTVLGLAARMDQNTLKDGFASLGELKTGDRVEIHGVTEPDSAAILATRVTKLPNTAASEPVEIVGTVERLSGSQFQMRGITVTTNSAPQASPPPGAATTAVALANGARVRAIGSLNGDLSLNASQIIATPVPARALGALVTVDGLVQEVLGGAPARVRINDAEIDVSGLPSATANGMVVGARAVVRGRKEATAVRASEARVIAPSDRIAYQVSGAVTDYSSRAAFKVRGEQINANAASFVGGTITDLAAGKRVRVIGIAGAGSLDATEVTFLP
jgi:hypothetical protein